ATITDALEGEADEDLLDSASVEERIDNIDGRYEADDANELEDEDREKKDVTYESRINQALASLWQNKDRFLTHEALETYSPKFLAILNNIEDPEHRGLNLIYSQFRTLEGIGIMKLVLMANGFAEFKIRKSDAGVWRLDINPEDLGKPRFALYTGTETSEEKEIVRNVFNSAWKYVPTSIVEQLEAVSSNNFYGEIIKVLMITSSGAEGIDLKNVRYVHLTESYWHPVRIEQVIGRARRICSHNDLPEALQTVEVFLYLMTFTQDQIKDEGARELRLKDVSKIDRVTPITSDESLYEISTIKSDITKSIMKAVKEASIDCTLMAKSAGEPLQCFGFSGANPNNFSYLPAMTEEQQDSEAMVNKRVEKIKAYEVTMLGTKYALDKITNNLYDFDTYEAGNPILVGRLEVGQNPDTGQKIYRIIPV
ncbi:MAG: helicase-related protein, partial [Candidatus Paceibacterota bacterium]